MRTTRVTATLAIAALGIASFTACAAPAGPVDPSERETLTITTINPLTGPAAVYGEGVVKLLELLIEDTNAGDGVTIGDTTYNLELESLNDEFNPEVAINVARQAIDDGSRIIFGPFGSGSTTAVQPLVAQGTALWQVPIASAAGVTGNPNSFQTSGLTPSFDGPTVKWIEGNDDIQRVALFTDQQQVGLVQSEAKIIADLEGLDREIVTKQAYTSGDTDFRAALTQILATDPDILLVRGYTAESILITEQVRELGSDVAVVWNGGTSNADVRRLVADQSIMANTYQAAPLSNLDAFVAAGDPVAIEWLERLDGVSAAADAYVHDGYLILLAILESSPDLEIESLSTAVANLTVEQIADLPLFNEYAGQDGNLVFKDRIASVSGAFTSWDVDKGWTPVSN